MSDTKDYYKNYKQNNLTIAKLDKLMTFVMESGGGKIGAIIAGVKILICFAYIIARNKLIDNELLILKQGLEKELQHDHQEDNEV